MFYAQITKDGIEFAAFETENEASQWIVTELGSDYAGKVWVGESGMLCVADKWFPDFTVQVHASLEDAIISNARLDPGAAAQVLRSLCDAIEMAEVA